MAIINPNYGGTSGGVTSFNGRDGAVIPQEGDYTAAMVGAATAEYVDDAIKVNNPVKGIYTKDEYDALSETEKSSGLFFVQLPTKKVGDVVEWGGYSWIVVNENDDNTVVLAMKEVYINNIRFGPNLKYSDSDLAVKAKEFEDSLPIEALDQAVETTNEGVTSKVFVPTYNQVFAGGFSYFDSNNKRACTYNGSRATWWLTTDIQEGSGYIAYISIDGSVARNSPNSGAGLRLFVTIKQNPNKTLIYLNGEGPLDVCALPDGTSIPSKTSDLENDSGFTTMEEVTAAIQATVGEVYSTEETMIGTWIDGRPLYQKTFSVSHSLQNASVNTSNLITSSVIKIVQGYGVFEFADLNNIYNVPYAYNGQFLTIRQNGDDVNLVSYFNGNHTGIATITLKYIKTTDQATIELPAALSETIAENIKKE